MIDNNNIYISIIICCYNSEKYISNTIKSIVNQTYKNWEIIFVNDGSSDKTEEIILNFIKNNRNISAKYFKQKNQGIASARNKGIELAKFDWIALLDHDDYFSSNKLEIQINNIKFNPTCHLFFGDHLYFYENTKSYLRRFSINKKKDGFDPGNLNLKKGFAYNNLIRYGCFIGTSTVMFNKSSCLKIGGFDTKYKFIMDYIFFNKMSLNYDVFCSTEVLCTANMHSSQSTQNMKYENFYELNLLYLNIYKSKNISMKLKINILSKHLRLVLIFYLKKFSIIK